MSLQNAFLCTLCSVFLPRRASISSSTFCDYTENVQKLLIYTNFLQLQTDTAKHLVISFSRYKVYLSNFNAKLCNLKKFRYTIYGIIFLFRKLNLFLKRSDQKKG